MRTKFIKTKYLSLSFLLCFFLQACDSNDASDMFVFNYESIVMDKEVYLIHTDDRFGEWGGNTKFVRLYRDNLTSRLLIEYIEYEGKLGPPSPPDPNSELKVNWFTGQPVLQHEKSLILTDKQLLLLSEAIKELLVAKINNKQIATMAGNMNRVMSSDSSFIIEDYPSIKWKNFHLLIEDLLLKD